MMPKLDGFGLLRRCAPIATLRDVPVILLSARAGEEARIEGLNAGADDYVVKPFTARELLARVGALLELTRTRAARTRNASRRELEDRRRGRRTSSSPCWRTSCAIRWRRSATPASCCRARCRPSADAQRAVQTIERQVTHLTRLVDDLLDVSRITPGTHRAAAQADSVADIVARRRSRPSIR